MTVKPNELYFFNIKKCPLIITHHIIKLLYNNLTLFCKRLFLLPCLIMR